MIPVGRPAVSVAAGRADGLHLSVARIVESGQDVGAAPPSLVVHQLCDLLGGEPGAERDRRQAAVGGAVLISSGSPSDARPRDVRSATTDDSD